MKFLGRGPRSLLGHASVTLRQGPASRLPFEMDAPMDDGRILEMNTVVLQAAARVESAAQGLYTDLAGHFSFDPHLRRLFLRLAAEEGQHALHVESLVRHYPRSLWSKDLVGRYLKILDAMTDEIEANRMAFRESADCRRPGSVLRQLSDMETRFNRFHEVELARSVEPNVNRFFASLALQDATHRELLQMARTRMGA